jgi:hypothetical protein
MRLGSAALAVMLCRYSVAPETRRRQYPGNEAVVGNTLYAFSIPVQGARRRALVRRSFLKEVRHSICLRAQCRAGGVHKHLVHFLYVSL